jgi:hypothetical protein
MTAAEWEELATNAKTLRIEQNEQQISITDDAGRTKTLYPDGKKHKEQGSGEQSIATKTRWDGDRLVAEGKVGHSGKLTETYELSSNGKQLYVSSRFDSSQLAAPLTIRRVYDQSTANSQ